MNIPLKLKRTRLSNNLTLEQLGDMVGRSKQCMFLLENGGVRLSYEVAVKIAAALSKTPDVVPLQELDFQSYA